MQSENYPKAVVYFHKVLIMQISLQPFYLFSDTLPVIRKEMNMLARNNVIDVSCLPWT